MGKTVSTLTAISQLPEYHGKILIIAPLFVAQSVWDAEIAKWDHLSDLTISKVLGSQKQRIAALDAKADMYIINRENVVWLAEYFGNDWPFTMVIIDELSSFKNGKSKRFLALKKVRPKIERIVGLTGSPGDLMALWAQIYLLDGGVRLGRFITHYRDRYFMPGKRNGPIVYEWLEKPGAKEAITNKISDICISMKTKDYLELPPVTYNKIEVELPKKVLNNYAAFKREMLLEISDTEAITAGSAGILAGKLMQFANGAIYKEDGTYQILHSSKLDALEEIVDITEGNLLVFYGFKHDKERILERIKNAKVLNGEKEIKDWNNGKIKVLLAHPMSASMGINLQSGGNVIVWFGLTWGLENYLQSCSRIYRQGQQNKVIIHHLVSKGTIDERVIKVLGKKEADQDELMNALKAELKG